MKCYTGHELRQVCKWYKENCATATAQAILGDNLDEAEMLLGRCKNMLEYIKKAKECEGVLIECDTINYERAEMASKGRTTLNNN
jgi:hypothetical protein